MVKLKSKKENLRKRDRASDLVLWAKEEFELKKNGRLTYYLNGEKVTLFILLLEVQIASASLTNLTRQYKSFTIDGKFKIKTEILNTTCFRFYDVFKDNKKIYLHRYIMGIYNSESIKVDHINRIKLDCRKINMRNVSSTENNHNSVKNRSYRGIVLRCDKKKWLAIISKNKQKYYLGSFDTPRDGAIAYDKKAIELYGKHALTNKSLGLL